MGADKFIDVFRPHKIAYLPQLKRKSIHLQKNIYVKVRKSESDPLKFMIVNNDKRSKKP